jgi:hypothetical protein
MGIVLIMLYTAPELNGHSVPYKGKRYWVIEVDSEHPFEWVDYSIANYAVYDKAIGYVIATIQNYEDGSVFVNMATHCESGFDAADLKEAAQGAGRQDAYMARMGWG